MKKSSTTLKKFRSKNKNKLSSQTRKTVLVRSEHLQKEEQIKDLEEVINDANVIVQNPREAEALRLLELRNYLQNFNHQKYFLSNLKNEAIRKQYVDKWQQIHNLEEAVNQFNATNFIFEHGKREVVPALDLSEFLQILEDKESLNQINESLYRQQSQLRKKIKNTESVFKVTQKEKFVKPKLKYKENIKRRDLLNFNDKIRKKFLPKVPTPFSFDLANKRLSGNFQYSFEKSKNYQKIQSKFVNAVLKKKRSPEVFAPTNWKDAEKIMEANVKIQKKFQTALQSPKEIKEEKKSVKPKKESKRQLQNDIRERIVIKKQKNKKRLHSFKENTKEKKIKFGFIKEIKKDSLEREEFLQSKIARIKAKMNRPKKKAISFSALRQATIRALFENSDSRFQTAKRSQEIQKRIAKLTTPKKKKNRNRKIS